MPRFGVHSLLFLMYLAFGCSFEPEASPLSVEVSEDQGSFRNEYQGQFRELLNPLTGPESEEIAPRKLDFESYELPEIEDNGIEARRFPGVKNPEPQNPLNRWPHGAGNNDFKNQQFLEDNEYDPDFLGTKLQKKRRRNNSWDYFTAIAWVFYEFVFSILREVTIFIGNLTETYCHLSEGY